MADDILERGDILVVIGKTEDMEYFKDVIKGKRDISSPPVPSLLLEIPPD